MAVLVIATAGFTAAVLTTADPESEVSLSGDSLGPGQTSGAQPVVESYIPGRGVEAFQQAQVGLDLAPGWTLTDFTLNGVAIPDEQLDVTLELDRYVFTPGDGKAVTALEPQTNCASALVFRLATGSDSATRSERWCFDVL